MKELSILIGGKAGDGIRQVGGMVARLFSGLGYYSFVRRDYPSLIRGGHTFANIRISDRKICSHKRKIDILVAFDQESIDLHEKRLKDRCLVIYDKNKVSCEKEGSLGIPISEKLKERKLPPIIKNTFSLGMLSALLGVKFNLLEETIKSVLKRKIRENIEIATYAYEYAKKNLEVFERLEKIGEPKPVLTGNEAIALGLVKGGMKMYIAYPMTPSTSILHFLAEYADELDVTVVQPENEISVILMAEGSSYAGVRTAVGTSGGGFALMVEALSLAGQAEIPLLIVLSQRAGPSTGVPTYTMQGDLLFSIYSGHGFVPRIVCAPGDAEEAFKLAGEGLNLAWKFQIPVILLSDKHLSECHFSCEINEESVKPREFKLWKGGGEYKRYKFETDGISPLAFPGGEAIVKATSYEHDEYGYTVEDPESVKKMQEKRLRKYESIKKELEKLETINIYGNPESETALITFGSTKGACMEVSENLEIKLIQVLYLEPFPEKEVKKELKNVKKLISVEVNASGQLNKLLRTYGIKVDEKILKYDARPFASDDLEEMVKVILK